MTGQRASVDQPITLAGRTFTLRFSTRAMAALQDLWGCKSLGETIEHLSKIQRSQSIDFDDAAQLVWAALRTHHQEVTIAEIPELFDASGLEGFKSAVAALSLSIGASQPPQEAGAGANPPRQKKSRSTN